MNPSHPLDCTDSELREMIQREINKQAASTPKTPLLEQTSPTPEPKNIKQHNEPSNNSKRSDLDIVFVDYSKSGEEKNPELMRPTRKYSKKDHQYDKYTSHFVWK
ncbi:ferrochelatase [Acrasis kona]|uniref:Ferrochelatase n=1 Tax=Acrasis kona TaxID=1008807 RepID=A0AAW2Z2L2_9EUKA